MKIKIIVKQNEVILELIDGGEVVDRLILLDEHNLSQILLVKIDELLGRNELSKMDIKNVFVESQIKESFTSVRIAEAVARTWMVVIGGGDDLNC